MNEQYYLDPDFEDFEDEARYLESLEADRYEEEYTGRPVDDSATRVGEVHHPQCPYLLEPTWECCKALYEDAYHQRKEREAEELHQLYWQ